MSEINLGQVVGPRGFQGIQGIKGDKGDQGIQGVVGPKVDVAASLGTSTVYAVSQKLLTDEVDKMTTSIATIKSQSDASIVKVDNADTKINTKTSELQTSIAAILGINKKLTNRINALEESNISSLFNNGASKGIWLDPSDLKTMFQNVGGASLPITKDGDPVGLMLDKSQGLEGAVTNVAKPFIADISNEYLEVTNTSEGTKLVIKNLSTMTQLNIFEVGKTYKLSVVYSIPETASDINTYNTGSGASNFLFTATKGVRNKVEITLTAKETALYFSTGVAEITIHEIVLKEIKGNHASQPLAASRPTYRTDGVLHWLQFDGVDDFLEVVEANKNIHSTNELSTSLVFKSGGGYTRVLWGTDSPFYSTLYSLYRNGSWQCSVLGSGKVISTLEGSNSVALAEIYSGSIENNGYFKIGGTEVVLDNLQSSGYQATLTGNLIIGSNTEQAYYNLNGTLQGLVMVTKKFTNSERNTLRTYLQRKAGVEI